MHPRAHALTQPDKPALIMAGTGRTITYAELDDDLPAAATCNPASIVLLTRDAQGLALTVAAGTDVDCCAHADHRSELRQHGA